MVKIHFRYGSKPLKKFTYEKKVFGGILGGHVFIEVNHNFYGFEPEIEKRYHFLPRKKYNAVFKKESKDQFKEKENGNLIVSVSLNLMSEQEAKLLSIVENYHNKVPYDYAVLGMRCGSSTYHILSQIEFFPKASKFKSFILIPYPKFLRKRIFDVANRMNWDIKTQLGRNTRKWEKD